MPKVSALLTDIVRKEGRENLVKQNKQIARFKSDGFSTLSNQSSTKVNQKQYLAPLKIRAIEVQALGIGEG